LKNTPYDTHTHAFHTHTHTHTTEHFDGHFTSELLWSGDDISNITECLRHNPHTLDSISKVMQAVKHYSIKIH